MNIAAPDFLRRKQEPAVPTLPRQERAIDAETIEHMEPFIQARRENVQLRERVSALEIDVGFKDERIRVLEESLNEAERKRDFYQFHSTSLVTRTQDLALVSKQHNAAMQALIGEMLEQAKAEAFKPRAVQPSGPLPEYDGTAELAAKLAPERTDA